MIKNQLYPYIEKYINEYLHGFTKEQLNVGVMNGTIALDKLNIRVDKVNEKLDLYDVPIWIKAGMINKIRVGCSLMNFIGEKPLEAVIEDIDCIISPSFKWVIKNMNTFIQENEHHIKESYDPTDNNSHDIFARKVNIYDSSALKKKQKLLEIFANDVAKSKISEIINKIFTKCIKFYYQKPYLINIKVKNVNIRFEDDSLINIHSNIGLGFKLNQLELNLSADGITKKNNFKCEGMNLIWEPVAGIIIPSKLFREHLDRDNMINEKYYDHLKKNVNLNTANSQLEKIMLVNNFSFMGNFGIQIVEAGGVDFFAKNRPKNMKFFIQVATSELNVNIYPEIIKMTEYCVDFMKSFYVIDPIQDFKPMRKPYNRLSELVKKYKGDPSFSYKRKMIIRDWLFYLVWFNRFKKAVYGGVYQNPLQEEFSKYFNICCLNPPPEEENQLQGDNTSINAKNLNDSIFLKKGKDNLDNSLIHKPKEPKDHNSTADLNPENINLDISAELLIKGINIYIHTLTKNISEENGGINNSPKSDNILHNNLKNGNESDFIHLKLQQLETRFHIMNKGRFDFNFEINNIVLNNKSRLIVNSGLEEKMINELHSHLSSNHLNVNNVITTSNNLDQIGIGMNNGKILNGNDSFTSDILSNAERSSNKGKIQQSNQNLYNAKNMQKLNFLNDALENIQSKNSNIKGSNKNVNIVNHQNSNSSSNFFNNSKHLKQANTNIKQNLVTHFLQDDGGFSNQPLQRLPSSHAAIEEEKSVKSFNLSKMLNDYNKNITKEKKSILVSNLTSNVAQSSNKNKITISSSSNVNNKQSAIIHHQNNPEEKIHLNTFEILPKQKSAVVVKFSKFKDTKDSKDLTSMNDGKLIEVLNITLGIIRANLNEDNISDNLIVLNDYAFLKKGKKSKNSEKFPLLTKFMPVKFVQEIYNMQKYIKIQLNNSKDIPTSQFQEISDFKQYINSQLKSYDSQLINQGKFEINYIFNKLNKKSFETNLNYSDCVLFFLNPITNSMLGIAKLPKINLRFLLQSEKVSARAFDFEFDFYDVEKWRNAANQLWKSLSGRIKFGLYQQIEPMMKRIIEEKKWTSFNENNKKFATNNNSNKNIINTSKAESNNKVIATCLANKGASNSGKTGSQLELHKMIKKNVSEKNSNIFADNDDTVKSINENDSSFADEKLTKKVFDNNEMTEVGFEGVNIKNKKGKNPRIETIQNNEDSLTENNEKQSLVNFSAMLEDDVFDDILDEERRNAETNKNSKNTKTKQSNNISEQVKKIQSFNTINTESSQKSKKFMNLNLNINI
jgi:hypothetical protein